MEIFLELFIGLLTVIFIWDYIHKRRRNRILKENGFKSPPSFPLIGSAHVFFSATPETIFNIFNECCKKFGRTWYLWALNEATIVTADPKLLESILSSNQVITKNNEYKFLNDWIGGGLLLSTGKKWHQRRKILTPTFHFKILDQFVEVFDRQSTNLVIKLGKFSDGKTIVDIFPKICLTALDIIAETAMGVEVNAQNEPEFPYVQAVKDASDVIMLRSFRSDLRYDWIMRLVAPKEFKTLHDSVKIMHDFSDKVIRERRAALEKSIADGTFDRNDESTNDIGTKKRMALLDMLLQANVEGNPLSNEDIREEVGTFMFAGHDTTTSGTSHVLFLLSRHPHVQSKLFEEIRSVFGDDKERPTSMHDLNELKYLECVIKEGLRIYPPATTIGRYVSEDVVFNGHLIPAKTNISILIYHVLRDPDYFPEPDVFKPERFDISTGAKINPFAYIPFSAGPRNCIGQKYAMYEMKAIITKVLRHFELLPLGENVRPYMSIVSRSANGVQLGLKRRVY